MNRVQYLAARKLLRQNGRCALSCMVGQHRSAMRFLMFQRPDLLAERAEALQDFRLARWSGFDSCAQAIACTSILVPGRGVGK